MTIFPPVFTIPDMKYPNRLRVQRAERRITQIDTALKAAIPQSRYWRIENGYDEATEAERKRLARVLKTDVDTLFPQVAA